MAKIHTIFVAMGTANSFLVQNGEESLVVDCGSEDIAKKINYKLKKLSLNPNNVKYIVVTHCHFDHTQGIHYLKKFLDKAKVVIHENEAKNLETGNLTIPEKFPFKSKEYTTCVKVKPDITFEKKFVLFPKSKKKQNIYLLYTPGHSIGSSSVVVNDSIIMGDSVECYELYSSSGETQMSCIPSYWTDVDVLLKYWKVVIDLKDVKYIIPSHGVTCKKEVLEKQFEKGLKNG